MFNTIPIFRNRKWLYCILILLSSFPIVARPIAPKYELIYSFGQKEVADSLIAHDAIGNHYGIISQGGNQGYGSIYRIDSTGQYKIIYSFDGQHGAVSRHLNVGTDGKLYGSTTNTNPLGTAANSTIYRLDPNQAAPTLSVLRGFTGQERISELVADGYGKLYGITSKVIDDTTNEGIYTIFSLDVSSPANVYTEIYSKQSYFGSPTEISFKGLVSGGNGKLYGVQSKGEASITTELIDVFMLDTSVATPAYTGLGQFFSSERNRSEIALTVGDDGMLYAVNNRIQYQTETHYLIEVYKLAATAFELLNTFENQAIGSVIKGTSGRLFLGTDQAVFNLDDSSTPLLSTSQAGFVKFTEAVTLGSDGSFYAPVKGTDAEGKISLLQISLSAGNPAYKVLQTFTPRNEGTNPLAGLMQASNGMFYGTTSRAGKNLNGSLFQLNISGTTPIIQNLHSFNETDGYFNNTNLVQARDGKIYGATSSGGANGNGAFYQLDITTSTARYTSLYNFQLQDGFSLFNDFFQGRDGKFYGGFTTGYSLQGPSNIGSIFQLDTSTNPATFNTIYNYGISDDVRSPMGLIQGTDGGLYGTTYTGTASRGTVFKIGLSNNPPNYSVLHQLDQISGINPFVGLLQASNGRLYGTAVNGGSFGFGTIFQVDISTTPSTLSAVHNFDTATEGYPINNLVEGSPGKLYGINRGVLYELDVTGNAPIFKTLQHINAGDIVGRMIKARDGHLYGVSGSGGTFGGGAIFRVRLDTPPPPPVNTAPVAKNDTFVITLPKHKNAVTINAPGVLKNDTDAENDKLSIAGLTAPKPRLIHLDKKSGSVLLYADGHFDYFLPAKCSFHGSVTFTYRATDGKRVSNPATVTLILGRIAKK